MKLFFVDVDDTLLDFRLACKTALSATCRRFGVPYSESVQTVYETINNALWKMLEKREITKAQLIQIRFKRFLSEIGCDRNADEMNAAYWEQLSRCGQTLPGAMDFMRDLNKRGRVYLVTNGTAVVQRGRQAVAGLDALADGVFISEEIGYNKPAREFFEYCLAHVPAGEVLVIGDTLSSDILGANNASLPSLWLHFDGRKNDGTAMPTYEATSYEGAISVIDCV